MDVQQYCTTLAYTFNTSKVTDDFISAYSGVLFQGNYPLNS